MAQEKLKQSGRNMKIKGKMNQHTENNKQNDLCAQRRRQSVWAAAQSDQSSLSVHDEETVGPKIPIGCTVKTDQTGQMPRLI